VIRSSLARCRCDEQNAGQKRKFLFVEKSLQVKDQKIVKFERALGSALAGTNFIEKKQKLQKSMITRRRQA
jgi:hypothetical protein